MIFWDKNSVVTRWQAENDSNFFLSFRHDKKYKSKGSAGLSSSEATTREYVAMFFVALITVFLVSYAMHCVWAGSYVPRAQVGPYFSFLVLVWPQRDGNSSWHIRSLIFPDYVLV
mgnify:CR=1 FL=1